MRYISGVKLLPFFVYSWMTFMLNSSGNFKRGVSYTVSVSFSDLLFTKGGRDGEGREGG